MSDCDVAVNRWFLMGLYSIAIIFHQLASKTNSLEFCLVGLYVDLELNMLTVGEDKHCLTMLEKLL